MVKYTVADLDLFFSALSDPTRRAILQRLSQGEATVTELARPFAMSLPAISKHLRVLEQAGLLHREREGRIRRCSFNAERVKAAADWLERNTTFWRSQLDALDSYLRSDRGPKEKP